VWKEEVKVLIEVCMMKQSYLLEIKNKIGMAKMYSVIQSSKNLKTQPKCKWQWM